MTCHCQVVPFPAVRRVGFIRSVARLMASYSPEGGERALIGRLNVQYRAMLRQGVAPDAADRELRSLELAVRAEHWAIVMRGGDVA